MNRILKSSFIAAAVVLTIGAAALPAAARAHVPFLGRAQNAAEDTCFSEAWGQVVNNGTCGTDEKLYIMPLVTDWSVWHNAVVNVYSPGVAMHCQAISTDHTGLPTWISPNVNVPLYDTPADIAVSTWVPAYGSGYVACWLGKGARINMLNY